MSNFNNAVTDEINTNWENVMELFLLAEIKIKERLNSLEFYEMDAHKH